MILERKVMKSMPKTQKTLKTLGKINISSPNLSVQSCVLKKPRLRFEKTSAVF